MTRANLVRGEVAVTIGGQDVVVACTMKSLAAFEALLDQRCPSAGEPRGMGEVLKFASAIPFSMIAEALECFVIDGDARSAIAGFDVADTVVAQQAINAAIMSKYASKPGNAEAAEAAQ